MITVKIGGDERQWTRPDGVEGDGSRNRSPGVAPPPRWSACGSGSPPS